MECTQQPRNCDTQGEATHTRLQVILLYAAMMVSGTTTELGHFRGERREGSKAHDQVLHWVLAGGKVLCHEAHERQHRQPVQEEDDYITTCNQSG